MNDFDTIALIKLSSLGDIIHTLPLAAIVRTNNPRAHISWIAEEPFAGLVESSRLVDEVIPYRKKHYARKKGPLSFFRDLRAFTKSIEGRRFDLVIDVQGLLRSALIARACEVPVKMGFANAREFAPLFYTRKVAVENAEIHAVDRYLLFARELGYSITPVEFPLSVTEDASRKAGELLTQVSFAPGGRIIGFAPFTRWLSKDWAEENFVELAKRIRSATGSRIVIIGGKEDIERAEKIARQAGENVVNLTGKTSIEELVAIIKRFDILITNDSGPMHIADALGVPLVALFGPTNPVRTGPYFQKDNVITPPVDCSPCYRKKCKRMCINLITVEQVMKKVNQILNNNSTHYEKNKE